MSQDISSGIKGLEISTYHFGIKIALFYACVAPRRLVYPPMCNFGSPAVLATVPKQLHTNILFSVT
jgi:hypothetical protein